jgi:anthranilate phosphoribosyltransferase
MSPDRFFGDAALPDEIKGGRPDENALITRSILEKDTHGPRRNIVLVNAGAAIVAANKAETLEEGIAMAEESIDSGAAAEKLQQLALFTSQHSQV